MRAVTPYPDPAILLTGHERRNGDWCWRPRGTPTPLLIHTRSGQGVVRVSGTVGEHMITAGETVLWFAGAPQDFGCNQNALPWEIVWAHFRPRSHWHDWLGWPVVGSGVARIPPPQPRVLARIDAALLEMDRSAQTTASQSVELALNSLERALLWLDAANPGPRQLDDRLHDAILFVASRLADPLSVDAIADAVQLSPSRLSHLFSEQMGVPPARYVEMRRIERAEGLLGSTALSIGAIAETTGFSSQFYFATRFKVQTGMSPSDWRRRAGIPQSGS